MAAAHINRTKALHLIAVDRELISKWTQRLQRRSQLALSINGAPIFLTPGQEAIEADLQTLALSESP